MLPKDQIDELKGLYSGLSLVMETGIEYIFIPNLQMPTGCVPDKLDALLCPSARDGYSSRLFFSQRVQGPRLLNWNANGVRIGERNWYAFSYKIGASAQRLAQKISSHLTALQ